MSVIHIAPAIFRIKPAFAICGILSSPLEKAMALGGVATGNINAIDAESVAGIINKAGNVMGMMPHPERASEAILGSEDGKIIFQSIIHWLT